MSKDTYPYIDTRLPTNDDADALPVVCEFNFEEMRESFQTWFLGLGKSFERGCYCVEGNDLARKLINWYSMLIWAANRGLGIGVTLGFDELKFCTDDRALIVGVRIMIESLWSRQREIFILATGNVWIELIRIHEYLKTIIVDDSMASGAISEETIERWDVMCDIIWVIGRIRYDQIAEHIVNDMTDAELLLLAKAFRKSRDANDIFEKF